MPVEREDARTRLRDAALALFRDRGYDRTTAAQIAKIAGVTERTFFRYFADKREALFDGEAVMTAALTTAIADAPAALGPVDTLFRAFGTFLPALEANRSHAKPRHDVIAATPALYERELTKLASIGTALAAALRQRGVADLRAELTARAGMVAFAHATSAWLDDPTMALGDRLDLAQRALKAMADG